MHSDSRGFMLSQVCRKKKFDVNKKITRGIKIESGGHGYKIESY